MPTTPGRWSELRERIVEIIREPHHFLACTGCVGAADRILALVQPVLDRGEGENAGLRRELDAVDQALPSGETWTGKSAFTRSEEITALRERVDTLERQNAQLSNMTKCGTCGGQPHASGLPCICGGSNTVYGETLGLRQRLAAQEQENKGLVARVLKYEDDVDEMGQEITALRALASRQAEALREIARMGAPFDAKGTHSQRVCDIARAALALAPATERERAEAVPLVAQAFDGQKKGVVVCRDDGELAHVVRSMLDLGFAEVHVAALAPESRG